MVKSKGLAVVGIVLVALLLVTACGTPSTPSGQNVLKIGALFPLTGGGGTSSQPSFRSFMDYVRYFNEEESIPGVSIEVAWRDTATSDQGVVSGYRALSDAGIPIIYSQMSLTGGIKPQLEKDQIPMVTGTVTAPVVYPPGWLFAAWATEGEAATAVLDYFIENWKEEKPPKLQLFISDTTYGTEPAAEITRYAERIGYEMLPNEFAPLVVIDSTTQLLRIQERQANLVYIQNIFSAAGPIMRDVERLGLQDEMAFAGPGWLIGRPLIQMAPVSAEGFLAPMAWPQVTETDIPGVKTMVDVEMKYHGEIWEGPEYMAGWIYGAIPCEAVKRAGEEVGYENIDGPAVKMALENMKDADIAGIVKVTYGPEERRGVRNYAVYQIQGVNIVRVSDFQEVPELTP